MLLEIKQISDDDDVKLYMFDLSLRSSHCFLYVHVLLLAGVPVGGKSSVCLICMKYMIIILIKVSIAVRIGGASDSRLCRK